MNMATTIIIACLLFTVYFNQSLAEVNQNNANLMKEEIAKAMEDCGEIKEDRKVAKEEFERRSGSPEDKLKKILTKREVQKEESKRDSLFRGRRNVYGMLEEIHKYLREKSLDESNSGEWDYDENRKSQGRSWNDENDDRSNVDSIYNHEKRNSTYSTNNNYSNQNHNARGGSTNGGYGRSLQDQNSSTYDQNSQSNNFDSRGGRFSPGFRNLMDDRNFRSVKNLNLTTNYYDPFMTRGIRSADSATTRRKRFDKLVKAANKNECLSQCVFTNLQIVDDRGIPKEALFYRLLQDNVPSEQSRSLLEKQIKACFQELAAEPEDNGCSYSNILDNCMGLQLRKRKTIMDEETNESSIK